MNVNRTGSDRTMELVVRNQVPFFQFQKLQAVDWIQHGFSTKLGGVSQGKYAQMNFAFTTGDKKEHVLENYQRMANALEVDIKKMVLSYQTHTTNVRVVTEEDFGKGIRIDRDYRDVDGLITNVAGVTLVTFYADCVPLYMIDPVHGAIGLSHSGWRGTVGKIGAITLEKMKETYGTDPKDVLVAIGPSICGDCFEVGKEVIEDFEAVFDIAEEAQWYRKKASGKYDLNLWKVNQQIFEECGVKAENIIITDVCTKCNPELLFSHRVSGSERGNLAAFLCIK